MAQPLTGTLDGDSQRWSMALLLSLLVHLALLLKVTPGMFAGERFTPPEPELLEVTLEPLTAPAREPQAAPKKPETAPVPLPEPPPNQLVSESALPEAEPPANTTLLSSRATRTEKQQIKRGEGGTKAAEPPPKAEQAAPKAAETKSAAKEPVQTAARAASAKAPPVKSTAKSTAEKQPAQLRLSDRMLESTLGTKAPAPPVESASAAASSAIGTLGRPKLSDEARLAKLREYTPFQRSSSAGLFAGSDGSPDYLPNIPDGDVTMLNAKADRHAVFVRRVAMQVFGSLRQSSWAELSFRVAAGVRNFVTVHVVMSPNGKLISARIEESSGTKPFDQILLTAAERGAWDQNPPATARGEDGNIHFIFQARSWARRIGEGGMQEQRWLLLATGLL